MPDDLSEKVEFLGSLSRLDLKPGDKFVLMCQRRISVEQANHIQRIWREFLGDQADRAQLLVLDDGAKLGAISAGVIVE